MKSISYEQENGRQYARVSASSYRDENSIPRKGEDGIYLGKVIDESNNVFYTKKRGLYEYDIETDTFKEPSEKMYEKYDELLSKKRKKPKKKTKECLDFGDSFFLYELIRMCGYHDVIDALLQNDEKEVDIDDDYDDDDDDYDDDFKVFLELEATTDEDTNYETYRDTLYALIQYYILEGKNIRYAYEWYHASIAKLLFPTANLTTEGIQDLLEFIGETENIDRFLEKHLKWITKIVGDDRVIYFKSKLKIAPMSFPFSPVLYGDDMSYGTILIDSVIHKKLGYPLMFRFSRVKERKINRTAYWRKIDFTVDKIRTTFDKVRGPFETSVHPRNRPIEFESNETFRGDLVLSMIAETIKIYISNTIKDSKDWNNYSRIEFLMSFRNLKCIAFSTRVSIFDIPLNIRSRYEYFGIECPIRMKYNGETLIPQYEPKKDQIKDENK